MPMYEFKCEACEHEFEELVLGQRDRKIPCPKCGSDNTHRLLSASCVHGGGKGASFGSLGASGGGCGTGGFS